MCIPVCPLSVLCVHGLYMSTVHFHSHTIFHSQSMLSLCWPIHVCPLSLCVCPLSVLCVPCLYMCTVYFQSYTISLAHRQRLHCAVPPFEGIFTSYTVVYWRVYAGIRHIPTSGFFWQRILTSVIINKQGTLRPFASPLCIYPPPFLAIHYWSYICTKHDWNLTAAIKIIGGCLAVFFGTLCIMYHV